MLFICFQIFPLKHSELFMNVPWIFFSCTNKQINKNKIHKNQPNHLASLLYAKNELHTFDVKSIILEWKLKQNKKKTFIIIKLIRPICACAPKFKQKRDHSKTTNPFPSLPSNEKQIHTLENVNESKLFFSINLTKI